MIKPPIEIAASIFGAPMIETVPLLKNSKTQEKVAKPTSKANPNQDEADLPHDDIQISEYRSAEELAALREEWDRLVELSIEPNLFLEPQFLLPALTCFASNDTRVLVATAARRVWPAGPRVICGIMPISCVTGLEGKLGRGAKLWLHDQSFLGHPLLRRDAALPTFRAMLKHLGDAGFRSLNLQTVPGDGPFQHLLAEHLQTSESAFFVRDIHHRAVYRPAASTEDYFARWPRSKRQSLNRLTRRLDEMGTVQTRIPQNTAEATIWIEQFLEMEAHGWKGEMGTALACNKNSRTFVQQVLTESFAKGKAMLLSLELDGRPVAMKCNLLSGDGGFAFKIAFDPCLHRYSPGCLLEKINIECLSSLPQVRWMDSCAQPNHPMIDSLWTDRRILQTITIGTQKRGSSLSIALLPLARWLQRLRKK